MRELLGRQFTVKDVTVSRDQLADARLLDEKRVLKPTLTGLKSTSEVDAYLVVVKHPRTVSEIEGAGVGIMPYTPLSGGINTGVFANYAVALVNAQTLEPIVGVPGNLSPKFPSVVPYKPVDRALWPERGAALSPAQADMIRQVLFELVTDSIEETMLRMKLSGMTIASVWPIQTEPPAETSPPQQ